ncbi:MAG TPA: hypothetical protein VFV03_02925 [Solirubrobacteraceae bacterium]|nr:hypothetical protein [Solirubrobacteraceae bacterium]
MKLIINRDQAAITGMLGGHKGVRFTLGYRLELTSDEMQLVQRYKLEDYPLTWKTFNGSRIPADTIGSMVTGHSETLTDVTTLVGNEATIKDACDALPPLFAIVRTFGGEEAIDYPRT